MNEYEQTTHTHPCNRVEHMVFMKNRDSVCYEDSLLALGQVFGAREFALDLTLVPRETQPVFEVVSTDHKRELLTMCRATLLTLSSLFKPLTRFCCLRSLLWLVRAWHSWS